MNNQSKINDNKRFVKKPYQIPTLKMYGKVNHVVQGSGGNGNDGGNSMTKMSDQKTKDNIIKIGSHPLGIGLYLFDYKPEYQGAGSGKQFGVLAHEVETVMPRAVFIGLDGIKRVNYNMLGISFGQ